MQQPCFSCGKPATCAVEVSFRGEPIGNGFVCTPCFGVAMRGLHDERVRLIDEGVPVELADRMIRQKVTGGLAQA